MARGRFLSKEICVDKKVNQLSSPWSMLAFTWLLPHADREGRTYGDPSIVKSLVFPRQDGIITTEQMEGYIREWDLAHLINWYEVAGDKYIEFPNFEKHQIGLRKEKEPASTIPPNIRQSDGKDTAECNEIEGNEIEGKGSGAHISPIQALLEKHTGITPSTANDLKALDEITAIDPIEEDIKAAINWLDGQGITAIYSYHTLVQPIRIEKSNRLKKSKTAQIADKNKAVFKKVLEQEGIHVN